MSTIFPAPTMNYTTLVNHYSIDDHFSHNNRPSFDEPPEDELPGYEQEPAPPSYLNETEPHLGQESHYKLKQWDRSTQKLVSLSLTSNLPSITIATKTRTKLFSSPPDIQFTLESSSSGTAAGRATNPSTATIRFDEGARTLPWFPKATLKVMGGNGILIHSQELYSEDFVNWNIRLNDGGVQYYWGVRLNPIALVLKNKRSEREVARFTYSEVGTDAKHGDYVGDLVVFGTGRGNGREIGGDEEEEMNWAEELRGVLIAVSAFVVVVYWRKLGRCYRNRGYDGGGGDGGMVAGREVMLTSPH